jgi:hypothetical protein
MSVAPGRHADAAAAFQPCHNRQEELVFVRGVCVFRTL